MTDWVKTFQHSEIRKSLEEFIESMNDTEREYLDAMRNYVKRRSFDTPDMVFETICTRGEPLVTWRFEGQEGVLPAREFSEQLRTEASKRPTKEEAIEFLLHTVFRYM